MSTEDTPHTGAVALSDLLDGALRTLEARQAEPSTPPADGFLYSGNRHESVPRKLFSIDASHRWSAMPGKCSG
jgi:hypothetical protein